MVQGSTWKCIYEGMLDYFSRHQLAPSLVKANCETSFAVFLQAAFKLFVFSQSGSGLFKTSSRTAYVIGALYSS